jgi:signal-transduction protein with cAMP-binding, CBS, and nucleotidyltransferase domain
MLACGLCVAAPNQESAMPAFRTAGDVCTRDVVVAFRSTALDEAARTMRERHVGCLVVVDETPEGRVVAGLLTDRDIVTAVVAKGLDAITLRVGDVMTEDVTSVREGDLLHDVIALMRHRRVRRVPVTAAQQRLVGVLASDDVIRLVAEELHGLTQALAEQPRVEQLVRP